LFQLETYDKPNAYNHGYSGPLKITSLGYKSNVSKTFLETAAKYDKDRGLAEDSNDFDTADKYTVNVSHV
jgi:alcohol oxidase